MLKFLHSFLSIFKVTRFLNLSIWTTVICLSLISCGGGQPPETYRVGLLYTLDDFDIVHDGFKAEMAHLGYVEGETIIYDEQDAGADPERIRQVVEGFAADKVDLIVTTTNVGALAARAATEGIDTPVVFLMTAGVVEAGIVDDLHEPEGNLTGVYNQLSALSSKNLELLHDISPEVNRLWVPHNPGYPAMPTFLDLLREAALRFEIELIEQPFDEPQAVLAELQILRDADALGFDAIMIMPDTTMNDPEIAKALIGFANEHDMILIPNTYPQLVEGGVFHYNFDYYRIGEQGATLAGTILQGSPPAGMPTVASEIQLTINLIVAEKLGLTIDDSIIALADEIIR